MDETYIVFPREYPFPFDVILDEISRGIEWSLPWCMLFTHDIALVVESKGGVKERLEQGGQLWKHKVCE